VPERRKTREGQWKCFRGEILGSLSVMGADQPRQWILDPRRFPRIWNPFRASGRPMRLSKAGRIS
jgi:hypothetical protein